MLKNKTILCFASGYDAPPTSKHHVMHLLARDNTVLWVSYHASRKPSISKGDLSHVMNRIQKVFCGINRVRKNLYVLTPLVLPLPSSKIAIRLNRVLIAQQIRKAFKALSYGPVQIWSFCPDVSYLVDQFDHEKLVYYCVDEFSSFTGYDSEQVLLDEKKLCSQADLVVTTSRQLQKSKELLNASTVFVPHGVDYAHFARAISNNLPTPADIVGIPHPRLGFFGLIRDWVDLELVSKVAINKPQWHFIFIGDSKQDLSPYRKIRNLHFLGPKPYELLPAYCKQFDAGLIPFRINELTRSVNPIKLREYLAAGLPVVSTPLPEVALYKHLIEIAQTPEQFAKAIETALSTSQHERHKIAISMAGESWQHKLDFICRQLQGGTAA